MKIIHSWFISVLSFCFGYMRPPLRIRQLLMWPIASRVLGMNYTQTFRMKAGFTLHGYMGDHLGRHIIFYGKTLKYFWEPSTTQLVEKLSTGAHTCIVAGSHIGTTVLYARQAMKDKAGTVHTFEPIAHLYERSKKNFELNPHLGSISIEKCALGEKEGIVTMTNDRLRSRILLEHEGATIETEDVQVTTIDSYCRAHGITHLDFILLDVEGYEFNALSGMQQMLAHSAPRDIIYEISHPHIDNLALAEKIQSFLANYGYTFYIIDDASDPVYITRETQEKIILLPATQKTYDTYKTHRYFNVYATKRTPAEVQNFCSLCVE